MDTIVGLHYLDKTRNFCLSIMLLLLLSSCPGEVDCYDLGSTVRIYDFNVLTPQQEAYNSGDILTLTVNIPTTNDYLGNEINLFQRTHDQVGTIVVNSGLFLDNTLTFFKGSQGGYVN